MAQASGALIYVICATGLGLFLRDLDHWCAPRSPPFVRHRSANDLAGNPLLRAA